MATMNESKLHHYVPRFYLKYFLDPKEKLWIYDKELDRAFITTPNRIAAENQFYRLPEPIADSVDPLSIEKNLSDLEFQAFSIIAAIVTEVSDLAPGMKMSISDEEKLVISEFLATQHFRTLEQRYLMLYFLNEIGLEVENLSIEEQKAIQFLILSESGFLEEFEKSIYHAIWMFAKNVSQTFLITSDHPVCIQSSHSRVWQKSMEPLHDGSYLVFPITPQLILYCHESIHWSKIRKYDLCLSPVVLEDDMVHHENTGQAFMSSRFLISCNNDFREVRKFIPSIGTGMYAAPNASAEEIQAVKRTAHYIKQIGEKKK